MTPQDAERLSVRLCQLWPGKMSDDDLARWAQAFDDLGVDDVIRECMRWKNESRFVPTVVEIRKRLGKSIVPQTITRACETFADIIRQANLNLAHKSDAQLVLAYHRWEWCVYRRSVVGDGSAQLTEAEKIRLDDRKASIERNCVMDLWQLDGFDRERCRLVAGFVTGLQRDYERAMNDMDGCGEVPI